LRSAAAGNMQVAITAVGFTALLFIIIILAGALLLGYGQKSDRSRRASSRGSRSSRSEARERNQAPVRGGFKAGGKFGVSHHRDMIQVEVNPNKCARFGFCEHEAPEIFYLESDGRFGYEMVVPVEKMEQVVTAMDVCPRRAIKVKLPKNVDALAPVAQPERLDDHRRTIVPILGDRFPDDDPGPRRA
jgi:ferredoxin